jgi:diguanylate cyclase (GGDEF)-like protein
MTEGEKPESALGPREPDPSICEQEAIHIPGAIQPHGALLAALIPGHLISHASANLAEIVGRPAEEALGRPLEEILGVAACRVLEGAEPWDGIASRRAASMPGPDGGMLHLRYHRSGPRICVDIEPAHAAPDQTPPISQVLSVIETFHRAGSVRELCEFAVGGLLAITGFDRVMAYRFDKDGHGEVIAEARGAPVESYLGLRYPAADIPPQARRLYLGQVVGAIADSSYRPVPLLIEPAIDDGTPLDLTRSALRSVSPFHLEYMRNMKTAASLTVGLPQGQNLWGMLICHHVTTRVAGPELRAAAAMIGQVVSLLLASSNQAEIYGHQLERRDILRSLIQRLATPVALVDALTAAEGELLRLVDATGAIVRCAGRLRFLGRTPPPKAARRAFEVLECSTDGKVIAIDDLSMRHSELAPCKKRGSGALLLPLATDTDDAILWFRPEEAQTVRWGRDPAKHAILELSQGLSPRASFAAWKETVRGRSVPWTAADLALAHEFRSAVEAEVTQRAKAELARLAHYDPLTGLANRTLFRLRIDEAIARARRGQACAVICIDLDRFKEVNDTLGHPVGDLLLQAVSTRIRAEVRETDTVARLGGDEFAVVQTGFFEPGDVSKLAQRLVDAIGTLFDLNGHQVAVGASIGLAVAPGDGMDPDLLLRNADLALYRAKMSGRSCFRFFEPEMNAHAQRRRTLQLDLRRALGDGEFEVYFQPQVNIHTRRASGVEALLRWRHPDLGLVEPDYFIPMSEEINLIVPLGEFVLRQACAAAVTWPDHLRVAVNLSPVQFSSTHLVAAVAGALEVSGLDPSRLELEITETALLRATDATLATLHRLRKLGVAITLDDFGTGYSSLSYLQLFPFDKVKIDRSFIQRLGTSKKNVAIVRAIIDLCATLDMSTTAEGVETEEQHLELSALGCTDAQGYLFGRPCPAEELPALLERLVGVNELLLPPGGGPTII